MIIYILKHSNSEFSGIFHGVGFSNGRGSTSSKPDRDLCVNGGCKDITSKIESIKAAQKKKEEAKAAKAKKADEKDQEEKKAEEQKEIKCLEKIEKEKAEEPEKEKR